MPEWEAPTATILVAEDNWANLYLLSELLQSQGYRVICALDGEQAFMTLLAEQIDLALLDVMMPRRTGFEVCRAVKSNPETRLIPVVLVTGLTDSGDRIKGIECGADDHHEKLDGSGYPDGLKGEEIVRTARILQTVDIYDALTTDRPYRKALLPQEAFKVLHEEVKRGWWDGSLLDEFEALILGATTAAERY